MAMASSSRALAQAIGASPRFEDVSASRIALPAPRLSAIYGRRISCSRSDRKVASWRSFAVVADMVIVDGVVKTEAPAAQIPAEEKVIEAVPESAAAAPAAPKSFLKDVSSLVKLVDSKDIVELELKHKDYEIVIRKAEALIPPAPAASAPLPYPAYPPSFPGFAPPQVAAAPPPAAAPASAPSSSAPAPVLAAAPQYPPLLSPMAGNFYRSPGPGELPFVKVGDKVRKGQVLCIIEAMKLMNEIESDQDGTIVEIVAEDGKPITTDAPLFVIKP